MKLRASSSIMACLCLAGCAATERSGDSPPKLSALASIVLDESDSIYIARPHGLAVTMSGRFIVSEGASSRVPVYSRDGNLLHALGRRGRGPGEFLAPSRMATRGDSVVWITDS